MTDEIDYEKAFFQHIDEIKTLNHALETVFSKDSRLRGAIQEMLNAIADVDGTMTAWLIGQAALRNSVSGTLEKLDG